MGVVGHVVGFVEDERLNLAQANMALIAQIEQAPWRCDHDVHTGTERFDLLALAHAAENDGRTQFEVAPIDVDPVGDLASQFARWGQDERPRHAWLARAGITGEVVQQRQRKGGRLTGPCLGYAEQVFCHLPRAAEDGYARAALVNQEMGFGAYIRFRAAELPYLVQWKMMGQGAYVVGLEPGNCGVLGRAHDRAQGVLRYLEPGESVSTHLEIGVLPNAAAIEAYAS